MDESKIKSIIKLHIIDKQLNEINELRGELPEKIDIYTGKIEQLKNGLKENKKNKLRDFVSVASHFQVTHINTFSETDNACYLKFGRMPRGPTLTFKLTSLRMK